MFAVKHEVPKFMRNWSRGWQWLIAILLFVLAMISLILVSEPVQPYIFVAGMLVALMLGALSTWLVYVIQVTRRRENIASARLVQTDIHASEGVAPQERELLPSGYDYCSGHIQSLPEDRLAVLIGDKRYSMGANGLFFSAKILDGDYVDAICRRNPFSPTNPLLLAVHVKRTGVVYGIGAKLYSVLAIGGACGVLISYLTPHQTNLAEWITAVFIAIVIVYVALVQRAKRMLLRLLTQRGRLG